MTYQLSPAQRTAVETTFNYWQNISDPSRRKFLWNAKPRFGKTLAAYDFACRISAQRILIITNRPAIADSWAKDFFKFIAPTQDFIFAASKHQESDGHHIYSRTELMRNPELLKRPLVYFISLQDVKGRNPTSQDFKLKNQWIFQVKRPWDLLIIDEGHDGAGTIKSRAAFSKINADFTLVLSGTPFRMLQTGEFQTSQIYNYTYLDEQVSNSSLPALRFLLADSDQPLNFLAQHFHHRHSLWLLSGVAECRSMAKTLQEHPAFRDYQIILAAGPSLTMRGATILDQVRSAISDHPQHTRTITLSCGQLTTGITVPAWSAVVMLYTTTDLSRASSAQYIQAAFRAQNPGKTAEIFDFSPDRALTILQDYAQNLCGTPGLATLLSYLEIKFHEQGTWQTLNVAQAQALSRRLVAAEVVDNGFMKSTKLFPDLANFSISPRAQRILQKVGRIVPPTHRTARLKLSERQPLAALGPTSSQRRSHKAQRDVRNYYEYQLRQLARNIPFLLHLYLPKYSSHDINFLDFLEQIPSQNLAKITGLTKAEVLYLINAQYLHLENLNLAINEFASRRYQVQEQIFTFIPTPIGSEIFTPLNTAQILLDKISVHDPQVFNSPATTFYDFSSSSGVILASIARRLFSNLRPVFPDDHACFLHILTRQVFASCSNEIYRRATLRTLLLLDNFTDEEASAIAHNIKIINPKKGLHMPKDFHPDIIISNPPYQAGHRQVYADFYKVAVDLDPEILCMVFPLGWQKINNHNGLGQLNNATYKRDPHLVSIDNYLGHTAEKLFPNLSTGGVNIVLRNHQHENHGRIDYYEAGKLLGPKLLSEILPLSADEVVKPPELTCLIDLCLPYPKLSALGSTRRPYGLCADSLRRPERYNLHLQNTREHKTDARLFGLLDDITRGFKYIPRKDLPKITACVDAWKLFVPKAWGNMSERVGLGGSYANICVARPGDVCSETFLEFGPFKNQDEAIKMAKYFSTQFFRALLYLTKTSQNTVRDKYRLIPVPDLADPIFNHSVLELNTLLFDHYKVPESSRDFILRNIQTRSEENIELL